MIQEDIRKTIKEYLLKYPNTTFAEIADIILDDGVITKSHRTIRRYLNYAAMEMADEHQAELDFGGTLPVNEDGTLALFMDMTDTTIEEPAPIIRKPKLLYLDIETARMIVGVWNIGKVFSIGPEQVIKDWFIYGWAARWYGTDETFSSFVTPEEAVARDDKRIMTELWPLLERADAVITHNGEKFDIPKIKTRFIMNNLPPVSSFRSIDTYRLVSKQLAFASNALKYLAHILTEKEKIATTYSLWIECEKGIPEALNYMEDYCIGDIDALEEVYLMLRPWMKSHPNLSVFTGSDNACCPNCGSEDISIIDSIYTTQQNAFPEMRCNTCGAVNRAKDTLISTAKRNAMIVPEAH